MLHEKLSHKAFKASGWIYELTIILKVVKISGRNSFYAYVEVIQYAAWGQLGSRLGNEMRLKRAEMKGDFR